MKPTKSILDPTFAYTSSVHTNVEKTWQRYRDRYAAEAKAREGERAAIAADLQRVIQIFDARNARAKP